jgi:hypothetical protein
MRLPVSHKVDADYGIVRLGLTTTIRIDATPNSQDNALATRPAGHGRPP